MNQIIETSLLVRQAMHELKSQYAPRLGKIATDFADNRSHMALQAAIAHLTSDDPKRIGKVIRSISKSLYLRAQRKRDFKPGYIDGRPIKVMEYESPRKRYEATIGEEATISIIMAALINLGLVQILVDTCKTYRTAQRTNMALINAGLINT